jgi:hypothetical protein
MESSSYRESSLPGNVKKNYFTLSIKIISILFGSLGKSSYLCTVERLKIRFDYGEVQ